MITYKRESIFPYQDLKKLDQISEEEVNDYLDNSYYLNKLKTQLNLRFKFLSKNLYEKKLDSQMNLVVQLRRKVNKEDPIECPYFLEQQDKHNITLYNRVLTAVKNATDYIYDSIFSNKKSYQYFLKNKAFFKAINYTNPSALNQLLNESHFNKAKYNRSRYSYIQRNITKTNSLATMGVTSFPKYPTIKNYTLINQQLITAFLFLIAKDPILQSKMKFKVGVFSERKGHECYLHRMYYTNPIGNNGFVIRENVLFESKLVKILKLIKAKNLSLGKDLKKLISYNTENDFDFFLNNNLITPDFEFYNDFKNLEKLVISNPEFFDLYNQIINENNNILSFDLNYFKKYDTYYFKKSLLEILNNTPINSLITSNHNHHKKFINLFDTKFSDYRTLENSLILNDNYKKVKQSIIANLEDSPGEKINVLDLFLDIEAKIIYKEDYWNNENNNYFSEISTPSKFYMVMFNVTDDNQAVINSIYPGDGFLAGREFLKFNSRFNIFTEHFEKHKSKESLIYEVVFDKETSPVINTGNSPYPKINWPEDFKNVYLKQDKGTISFLYKNKRIAPTYFGSTPAHLFTGAKGLFLQYISPWKQNTKSNINWIEKNKRYKFDITYKQILNNTTNNKDIFFNILRYFQNKNLPLKFFMSTNLAFEKPIYISLLNSDAYWLFVNKLKQYKTVSISSLNPNLNNYSGQKKLHEHINIFTQKELENHVDKLPYIQY